MDKVTVVVEIESCRIGEGALSCDELLAYPGSSSQLVEAQIVDGEATQVFMARFLEDHKDAPPIGLGSVQQNKALPFIFEIRHGGSAFVPAHDDGRDNTPVRPSPSMAIFPKTRRVAIRTRRVHKDGRGTATTLNGRTLFFDGIWSITAHERQKVQTLARALLDEGEMQADMILRVNHLPPDHHVPLTVFRNDEMSVAGPTGSQSMTFYEMYTDPNALDTDMGTEYSISRQDEEADLVHSPPPSPDHSPDHSSPPPSSHAVGLFVTSLVILLGILANFGMVGISNHRRRTRLMLVVGIMLGLLLIFVHLLDFRSSPAVVLFAALPVVVTLAFVVRMRAFTSTYLLASLAFFAVHFTWILAGHMAEETSPPSSPTALALALVSVSLFVVVMFVMLSPAASRLGEKMKARVGEAVSKFNQ